MATLKKSKKGTLKKPTKKELEAERMRLIDMDGDKMCRRCEGFVEAFGFNCGRGRWLTKKTGKTADIMILIAAPTGADVSNGEFGSGLLEKKIVNWLQQTGLDKKRVYIDSAVRCNAKGNPFEFQPAQTRKKLLTNCRPYLLREIERLKPAVIVPLGEQALKALLDLSGINGWNGRILTVPQFRARVVPVYEPIAAQSSFQIEERALQAFENVATALVLDPVKQIEKKTVLVETKAQAQAAVRVLKSKRYAFDIETKRLSAYAPDSGIIGFSVSNNPDVGYFFPCMNIQADPESDTVSFASYERHPLYTDAVKAQLKSSLEDEARTKYIHNLGFEWEWLAEKEQIHIAGGWDTFLANNVLDPFLGTNGLKELSYLYADSGGYEDELEDFFKGISKARRDYSTVPPDKLGYYAAMDAIVTYQLGEAQQRMARNDRRAKILREFFELRKNLSEMSYTGCPVDVDESKKLSKKFDGQAKRAIKELVKVSGDKEFNPNSSGQVLKFFYGSEEDGTEGIFSSALTRAVLGYKAAKKPSMDKFAMQGWLDFLEQHKRAKKLNGTLQHGLKAIEQLKRFRVATKMKSTFTDVFQFESRNSRISPTFNTGVTATARLSCSSPNMQQIPRKHDIRNCIASDSGVIAELDYSQLEIRIAAESCRDKNWIELLNSGADTHAFVGVNTIGRLGRRKLTEADFADGELRAQAKIVGFSVIYGKTPQGLSKDLGVTVDEAAQIIELIFDTFPKLREWVESQKKFVRQHGYVETLFHRRLPVYAAYSNDDIDLSKAFRLAVNYPIQSAASDRVVIALNAVHRWLRSERLIDTVRPVLTVHDSILFEITNRRRSTEKLIRDLKKIMEAPVPEIKHVQLKVDAKAGECWGLAKKVR